MPAPDYPFVFECTTCGQETTVTREDALGLYSDPESVNAVSVVLEQRGWMRGTSEEMLFCPACTGGRADSSVDRSRDSTPSRVVE
jgi:subtilase family serine protease